MTEAKLHNFISGSGTIVNYEQKKLTAPFKKNIYPAETKLYFLLT